MSGSLHAISLVPDTTWLYSMGTFKAIAGACIAVFLVLAVVAFAGSAVLLALSKPFPGLFNGAISATILLKILLGAVLVGSLVGLVSWGTGLLEIASFTGDGVAPPITVDRCSSESAADYESCK